MTATCALVVVEVDEMIADACVVRMSDLTRARRVVTVDGADFAIHWRHRSEPAHLAR